MKFLVTSVAALAFLSAGGAIAEEGGCKYRQQVTAMASPTTAKQAVQATRMDPMVLAYLEQMKGKASSNDVTMETK